MRRATLLVLLFVVLVAAGPASATPYRTWTLGPGGYPVPTQDAYTPRDQIDLPVSAPEDMFVAPDGSLYIADTGNGRIIRLDEAFQIVQEYGAGLLDSPSGLFVDEDGTLFIADSGSNTIFILDSDGNLITSFGRPDEPLFGEHREFLPRKIAVDARKNLYVVSEGSVDGLVMLNTDGDFIGYFGANNAEMSLKMILQRMFLTEEQLDQFIRNEAASPSNIAIDDESLVYTITSGTEPWQSVRRFTVSGRNLIDYVWGSESFRDIHASDDGLVVAVDDGAIFEYDENGTLLFTFGAHDMGDQRMGLLSDPTAIERVGDDLYVLDREKNAIVIYGVTEFAQRVHDGVRLYTEGFYTEARPDFEDVLAHNGLTIMAYQALADADFNEGNYANALTNYRLAEDRRGYSEAFWELRNSVLQEYLGTALVVLAGAWVGLSVFGRLSRRFGWLEGTGAWRKHALRIHLVDDFAFMFRFIKKPADSFYYIKQKERGSLLFAFLVFGWVVVVRILSLYITGFVFNPFANPWEINVETEVIYTIVPLVLWIVANYLIASISNGEGSMRQVVIGTAYSLFPYVLLALPITLLSNLLTFNESFIYNFSMQLIIVWSGIMIVIMVKEVHNYSFGETVRCILISLFTMAMFLLAAYILYVLFSQLFEFIGAVMREASLHA